MACMKARETFLIDCAWSIRQTGLILAKRAAIIMSVWLTLDNVTERSSALRVHSARRPLCLCQSKLGEILQTSDTQSLFVLIVQRKVFQHCNKNDFLGTCEFLWYKPGAEYSCILQSSWSMAFPLWSKHQMVAVLQNLQWTVLVCNLWYLVLGTSAELTAESTCTQPLVALWRVGSARHLLLASFMVSPRKVLALL